MFEKYITSRKHREHIAVVGPMAEAKSILNELYEAGFRVTRSGAYTNDRMWPKCDPARFLYEAEREVNHA